MFLLTALAVGVSGCWNSDLTRDEAKAQLSKWYFNGVDSGQSTVFDSTVSFGICNDSIPSNITLENAVSYIKNLKDSVSGVQKYGLISKLLDAKILQVKDIVDCDANGWTPRIIMSPVENEKNLDLTCDELRCTLKTKTEFFDKIDGITQKSEGDFERIVDFTTVVKPTEMSNFILGKSTDETIHHVAKFRKFDDGWRLVLID